MAIYVVANNKGGSKKTATAINLIPHLALDFVADLDKYHALKKILEHGENPIEVRIPKTRQEILDWADEDKNILIDCGGFDSDFTQAAISQADVVITPSNDDPTEQLGLSDFNQTMANVSKMVGEKLVAKVVISGVHHSRSDFSMMKEFIGGLSHLELLPVVIPHSSKIPAAQFEGKPVMSGTIAAKFHLLAKSIKVD
ncbi:ParA family protein [Vibrio coralliilyticus]|uniref:ParA family protein n=1 Tax=Vibrio TaxID=662 RepID=UPI00148D675D|nr:MULTISPECIES: ParA family protein [Vibrio]NOH26214.1 ParA family protein [Vibrio europaeus]NOH41674.1 ParA family protein [Vibrio coralliilyticus]